MSPRRAPRQLGQGSLELALVGAVAAVLLIATYFVTQHNGGGPGTPTGYTANAVADAPLAFWRLTDPAHSTAAADSGGKAQTAAVHGGVRFGVARGAGAPTPSLTAAQFDGATGYLDAGAGKAFDLSSGSLEAWVRTTSAGDDGRWRAIIAKDFDYGMLIYHGHLDVYDWSSSTSHTSSASIDDGRWHYVVVTFQSGVAAGTKMYVDGTLVGTTTMTALSQSAPLRIGDGTGSGSASGVTFFGGTIADAAVYGTVLTQAQVSAHYAAGLSQQ